MKPILGLYWLALGALTGFLLAGSIFWGASFQAPSHGAERRTEQHAKTDHADQTPASKPEGTRTAPFFVEVIPGPKSAEERAQEAEDREEKKAADRWLVRWTAMLFVATVGLILATGVLGYFGSHQARDMKASIKAAQDAANAAKASAESLPIIEGAYVYPVILDENIAESMTAFEADSRYHARSLIVTFQIKNFGKTPAIILSCNADLIHPDSIHGTRTIEFEGRIVRDMVLGAGEATKENMETAIDDFSRIEFVSVKNGDSHLTFNGHVAYADIFGNTWIYRFDWQYGRIQRRLMPDNQPRIKKT